MCASRSLSIITSISFDHTQYLGNTLAQIAMEKAGIVKAGRPCLSGVQGQEARAVIEEICRQRAAPLKEIGRDFHYRHEPAVIARQECHADARHGDGQACLAAL